MNLDIDGGTLLYALGVLFGLGALTYFARDVVFGLSITVTAALLFAAFLAFLAAGLALDRDRLDVVAYALSASSYAVFLGYVTSRYAVGDTGVFLLLAASAALFVGLGYGVRRRALTVDRRTAAYVVVGVAAASAPLIAADAATGDVRYDADLVEETTVQTAADRETGRVPATAAVGTLAVRNPSPFARATDLPDASACVVGVDAPPDAAVEYDPRGYDVPDRLDGGGGREHDVVVRVPVAANDTGTYAVERDGDCDTARAEPTIVVSFGGEVS